MLASAARSLAALRGRPYVVPDDVKELFLPAVHHRIVLGASAEVEGQTSAGVLRQILETVAVPR
jgi:MoxR-like ATPase